MKLGIISDAYHYYDLQGQLCTLTLLARQLERWAGLFDEVIICAPFIDGPPLAMYSPYRCNNIRLMPIAAAGGNTIFAKLDLLKKSYTWIQELRKLLKQVDAIHIRCPNNISILGLILLQSSTVLRQAVYTGSWQGYRGEPITYWFQRWFLRNNFHGPVAVYGDWPDQPSHVVSSFSPSYSQEDWENEVEQVQIRLQRISQLIMLPRPVHLLSVGALNKNKNQVLILQALYHIVNQGLDCRLDILGDGPQRSFLEQEVDYLSLSGRVMFHGNIEQKVVREFYRRSDFVVQAPYSEGFGKVPVEAFFHGVIPILSDVDVSNQIVGNGLRGLCFPQGNALAIARHVVELSNHPEQMAEMIRNGREYALGLTLEAWQQHISGMLNTYWQTNLKIYP